METLKISNLTKSFPLSRQQRKDKKTTEKVLTAVNHVSFSLNDGEIYGLLGPNGAGKTTTLRMIATLLTPDEGEITINGINIKENQNLARNKIGFLTSELKLDAFFTPDYTFDFFASLYGLSNEVRDERKKKLFAEFGIDDFKYKKIGELSTGMKQKVSLTISLIHDPELIVFDEPTNGLDIVSSKIVEDFLLELKKQNKTIIISTHIFSLVEKLCDRVGIIIDGKLVLDERMDEINKTTNLETEFFKLFDEYKGGNE